MRDSYMQKWKLLLTALVAAIAMAACTPVEQEPEEPEGPPPPSPAEIRQEITSPLNPVIQQGMVPWSDLKELPGGRGAALDQVRSARQRHLAGEHGEEGIRMAADYIEENLRNAYEMEAWPLTVFLYNALDAVLPSRANNYVTFRDRAQVFIRMPRPTITGFFDQGGNPVVFLDVFLPEHRRTEQVRIREGEEFNGMVLVEIKGQNRGAIFEHIETGEIIDLDFRPRAGR